MSLTAITGKEARRRVPVEALGEWRPRPDRRDPVTALEDQGYQRDRDLLPVRFGRMVTSPLAFYRGAAAVMSADLATLPGTGIVAQLAGDAQIANFGLFEAPGKKLVFGINDFDETLPGPWEWDVRRLAASLEIAGRDAGWPASRRGTMVAEAANTYQTAMLDFATAQYLDVWTATPDAIEVRRLLSEPSRYGSPPEVDPRARARENHRKLETTTEPIRGELRFRPTPPLVQRIADSMTADEAELFVGAAMDTLRAYAEGLSDDNRQVFERFEYRDIARKTVGIGSIGLHTLLLLFQNRETSEALVLQVREAGASALEPHSGRSAYRQHGRRVVEGQRLMQAAADPFLGWVRGPGLGGVTRDYYVRQLWDWKVAADTVAMTAGDLRRFARLCGWTLARAHARSGNRVAIAEYLQDPPPRFAAAMQAFAAAYADQNDLDFDALVEASSRGRIIAQAGA